MVVQGLYALPQLVTAIPQAIRAIPGLLNDVKNFVQGVNAAVGLTLGGGGGGMMALEGGAAIGGAISLPAGIAIPQILIDTGVLVINGLGGISGLVGIIDAMSVGNGGGGGGSVPNGGPEEFFSTPADAIGDLDDTAKLVGYGKTNHPQWIDWGYTDTFYFRDSFGDKWTVFFNPKLARYSGAHLSSGQ